MCEKDHQEELDKTMATKYRAIVARVNFIAQDRPDLQYATKECAREMASPNRASWSRIKRIGRYLAGHKRLVITYLWQCMSKSIDAFTDASWAGCKVSRKSTSGGAIMWGKHFIKSWSKTQPIIALSSGEAELYGAVKAATEGIGIQSLLLDLGISVSGQVLADASAALGIIARRGLGKVRHLDTSFLWVQEVKLRRNVSFVKVKGAQNVADMMTKLVDCDTMKRHLQTLNVSMREGRAGSAPQLQYLGEVRTSA